MRPKSLMIFISISMSASAPRRPSIWIVIRKLCRGHSLTHGYAESRKSFCPAAILSDQCLLWVKSGRDARKFRCPLYPRKRTWLSTVMMSALGHKQTHALQHTTCTYCRYLLDHLVGAAEQCEWHSQAESLGGLEIDDQLNFCGLLYRQVRRLFTL